MLEPVPVREFPFQDKGKGESYDECPISPTIIPKNMGKKMAISGLGSNSVDFAGLTTFIRYSNGLTNRGLS